MFVRIKLIQRGFSDWKLVGVFIILPRLNNVMKSTMYLLEAVKLKSPRRIICSYLERYLLRTTPRVFKKYFSFCFGSFPTCFHLKFKFSFLTDRSAVGSLRFKYASRFDSGYW